MPEVSESQPSFLMAITKPMKATIPQNGKSFLIPPPCSAASAAQPTFAASSVKAAAVRTGRGTSC